MKIMCEKCGYIVDRDKRVDGEIVEEYKNVFGATCPNCRHVIKPFKKPFFNKKREDRMEILKEEMRERLRKI